MRFIPICFIFLLFSAVIGKTPYQLKNQSTIHGKLNKVTSNGMFLSYLGQLSTKRDDSPNYNARFESMLKWLDTIDSLEQRIQQMIHNIG